jgi:hypothetical protein
VTRTTVGGTNVPTVTTLLYAPERVRVDGAARVVASAFLRSGTTERFQGASPLIPERTRPGLPGTSGLAMTNHEKRGGGRSTNGDRGLMIAIWTFAILEAIGIVYFLWSR